MNGADSWSTVEPRAGERLNAQARAEEGDESCAREGPKPELVFLTARIDAADRSPPSAMGTTWRDESLQQSRKAKTYCDASVRTETAFLRTVSASSFWPSASSSSASFS